MPLAMTYHMILHVFIQVNDLIMDRFKVKEMIDSISIDGMRWREKHFHRKGMEYEYVLHYTHDEEFSVWLRGRAFILEIENFQLTATQELKLLEARTDLEPNEIMKELKCTHIEIGPDLALQMVWEILNETYFTPLSTPQQLLKKLVQGPIIRTNDSSAIFKLSIQCRSAQKLHQAYSDVISFLQNLGIIEAIFNRLEDA